MREDYFRPPCVCFPCREKCHKDHEGVVNLGSEIAYCDCNEKYRLFLKQQYLKKRKIVIKVFKNLEFIKSPLFFKDIIFILLSKNFLLLLNEVKIFTETFFFTK